MCFEAFPFPTDKTVHPPYWGGCVSTHTISVGVSVPLEGEGLRTHTRLEVENS
jgi:hypothetical protein